MSPAVLTAITFPELPLRNGELAIGAGDARLLAGLIAILVSSPTKRIMPAIVLGMSALWLLQYLI